MCVCVCVCVLKRFGLNIFILLLRIGIWTEVS